jgi:polyhydroxybutyrate depolymerase
VSLTLRLPEEVDDIGFISAVVDTLVKEGVADRARVFVTGISRGALMTWTLACERADLFAAVAPISSAMTETQQSNCHPSRPVPVIAVDGTDDTTQFYDGFIYAPPVPRLLSVPETMAFWWKLVSGCEDPRLNGAVGFTRPGAVRVF